MKKLNVFIAALTFAYSAQAQNAGRDKGQLTIAEPLQQTELNRGDAHLYSVNLKKGNRYIFSAFQAGIDIVVKLVDRSGKQLAEKDSPNGTKGFERLAYIARYDGLHQLQISALDDSSNTRAGKYDLYVGQQDQELVGKLAIENRKNIQTLDIDHFWEAYDSLKRANSFRDSVLVIQRLYIDRATEGFEDFLSVRGFTAPEYVRTIKAFPKFYQSIRPNTYATKSAAVQIQKVFDRFSELYPNFKPFKVNFAVGTLRTGGTVSNRYVLIGSEISTATNKTDLSEFNNSALAKVMAREGDVEQLIMNIVAHECVHTQQSKKLEGEQCNLLTTSIMEGACDFIGELISGSQINKVAQVYGNENERELAKAFFSEPCDNVDNWLYNMNSIKDGKPADLGYFMGYKIAQSYYNEQADKKQAITDIIEMKDPKLFLERSRYKEKFR
ncbi:MAG TPA: DUF2268 domain-containing putative Zn-dependent protease [Sphingobacteriaceae bacterium]